MIDDSERTKRPSQAWLRAQLHPITEGAAAAAWWKVLPLEGGLILSPEPLLTPIRRTTYEDFIAAVEGANIEGRKRLAALFPEYVGRARMTVENVQTGE